MDIELANRFFNNVKWFNNFFHDLKTLLDKITSEIEGYDKKVYYYFKANDIPAIPQIYYVLLGSDELLNLNLSVVLDKEFVTNPLIPINEPVICVVLHTYEKHDTTWITRNILQDKYLKEIKDSNDIISGIIDWGTDYPEIQFYSFTVSLSLFTEYSEAIVKEKIVDKVNEIQEQHDELVDE